MVARVKLSKRLAATHAKAPKEPSPAVVSLPEKVTLESTTHCQLRCPSCPTTQGKVGKSLGNGHLTAEAFLAFVQRNPFVRRIELSNWGEIFLNPELKAIIELAPLHNVTL